MDLEPKNTTSFTRESQGSTSFDGTNFFLLWEAGSYLLLEGGDKIIVEVGPGNLKSTETVWTLQSKN